MPVSRRTALKALALPALVPAVSAGCGTGGEPLRVAVVWSGYELRAFREVLAAFHAAHPSYDISVVTAGDDIASLLGAEVAASAAPDVALLPRPALIEQYRDRLVPLDPALAEPFPDPWNALSTVDGTTLGIWYKTAHKSMVWYRPDIFRQQGLTPPADWDEWQALNRRLARAGYAPLALGADDGWVLTDWFENVLLGLDPRHYQSLAETGNGWRTEQVTETLRLLARMWSPRGTFPGGVDRALLTQFEESVVDVFHRGRAVMVAEGDFTWTVSRYKKPDVPMDWFPFPAPPGGEPPVVAAGDAAVLLEPGSQGGRELVNYLATAEAAEVWAPQGGFVSVRAGVDLGAYPDVYTEELVQQVRDGVNGQVAFDLSDQLTGRLGGGHGRGLWRELQNFLAELGSGVEIEAAVGHAVDTLADLAVAEEPE